MLSRSLLVVSFILVSINVSAYPVEYPRPEWACNTMGTESDVHAKSSVNYQIGLSAVAPGVKEVYIYRVTADEGPVLKRIVRNVRVNYKTANAIHYVGTHLKFYTLLTRSSKFNGAFVGGLQAQVTKDIFVSRVVLCLPASEVK